MKSIVRLRKIKAENKVQSRMWFSLLQCIINVRYKITYKGYNDSKKRVNEELKDLSFVRVHVRLYAQKDDTVHAYEIYLYAPLTPEMCRTDSMPFNRNQCLTYENNLGIEHIVAKYLKESSIIERCPWPCIYLRNYFWVTRY